MKTYVVRSLIFSLASLLLTLGAFLWLVSLRSATFGMELFVYVPGVIALVAWVNALVASILAWRYRVLDSAPVLTVIYVVGVLAGLVLLGVVYNKSRFEKNEALLAEAVGNNDIEKARSLLSSKLSLPKSSKLDIAERLAWFTREKDMVQVFLDEGLEYGEKILCQAAVHDLTLTRYLIQKGVDVNRPQCEWGGGGGRRPLAMAKYRGILRLLIESGADLNAKDYSGDQALAGLIYTVVGEDKSEHDPAKWADLLTEGDLIEALRNSRHKFDVTSRNPLGETALQYAVSADLQVLAQTLLERGADPNREDTLQRTALANAKSPAMVGLLLKHGADVRLLQTSKLRLTELEPSTARDVAAALRKGGVILDPKTELELAAWTDDLQAVQARVTSDTPAAERKEIVATAIGGDALQVLTWLQRQGKISDADQVALFETALSHGSLPVLDVLKDWGRAALQRGEGNSFFSGFHDANAQNQYDVCAWLLRNAFITKSTHISSHWYTIPSEENVLPRLLVGKIIDPENAVLCKRLGELVPFHNDNFSIVMDNAGPAYLRRLLKCYSREDVQTGVADYLRQQVYDRNLEKVKAVLALLDDWRPYVLRPQYYEPGNFSDEPAQRANEQAIYDLLQKSGVQLKP